MKLIDFLSLSFMCTTCDYFIYYAGELVYKGNLAVLNDIPAELETKNITFVRPSLYYETAVFTIFLEDTNA